MVNDNVNFCPCSNSFQNILKDHGILQLVTGQLQRHLGDRSDFKKSCFKCPAQVFKNDEFYQHLLDKGKSCAIHFIFQKYMDYMYSDILKYQKKPKATFKSTLKKEQR